jgi:hypothetical protein
VTSGEPAGRAGREAEELRRVREAFARVFDGCEKLALTRVAYEDDTSSADEERIVIAARSRARVRDRGWLTLVRRVERGKTLALLREGYLEIAAEKVRQRMLDGLAIAEEGIPGREHPLVDRLPWEREPPAGSV